MRRRSRTGGEPVKARRRKTVTLKRHNAPKAARRRESSPADLNKRLALFKRDRDEAVEQFSAASKVLKLISSSPGDLKPVFEAILENATRICIANFAVLHLYESGGFRMGATHNAPSAFARALARREPIFRPSPRHHLTRLAATKNVVRVCDLAVDEAYEQRQPQPQHEPDL